MLGAVIAAQLIAVTVGICDTGSRRTCHLPDCTRAGETCLENREWGPCTCVCDDSTCTPIPDPATIAPPLSLTAVTPFANRVAFLHTGENPIQLEVLPGTLAPERVSVIRGEVQATDGTPLSGVEVSISGHPEYGYTFTRADGAFDLAVNGGGVLVVHFHKAGFLPVHRNVPAPWQDFARVRDVVMIRPDSHVTTITASAPGMQVARGTLVTDASGTRQATLLFPPGTSAGMTLPEGASAPLYSLNVRLTEYTATSRGAAAMPGELPPTTGFTYAVELGVDEAVAADATDVTFNRPVMLYLENHLRFPVGGRVPTGYYDRPKAAWVASADGRVLKVLSVAGGIATLDLDGSGTPADAAKLVALGITSDELVQVAQLYPAGQELWRVQVAHFSAWDCNWPAGCATACAAPNPLQPLLAALDPCGSTQSGSKIECQNQVLGEEVPIVGTPFRLHYQSDRMAGNLVEMTRTIRLIGDSVPSDLLGIELNISIAGQVRREVFSPPFQPNQTYSFTWDGLDAYGREYAGKALLEAEVGYVFQSVYLEPSARTGDQSFGALSSSGVRYSASRTPGEPYRIYRTYAVPMGTWRNEVAGLGGWSITPHHAYDPGTRTVYLGDGTRRSVSLVTNTTIATIAGNGSLGNIDKEGIPATNAPLYIPEGVAVAPDGSVFVSEGSYGGRVRRIDRNGIIRTYAGRRSGCVAVGEGGVAADACMSPYGIAVAEDGTVYTAEWGRHKVRKVTPDGRLYTVAGTGVQGFSGDGGSAVQAQLNYPRAVAVGQDGSIVVLESCRVRRIDADGTISTLTGAAGCGFSGDGGPAVNAKVFTQYSEVNIGPDGSIYIADSHNRRVRRIGPDGIMRTFAGSSASVGSGDGGPAIQAGLGGPEGLGFARDGSLYLTESYGYAGFTHAKIRKVRTDGTIVAVAGKGPSGLYAHDDGRPALEAVLDPGPMAIAPDGRIYFLSQGRLRMLAPPVPRDRGGDLLVASASGDEVYAFDWEGRHTETIDSRTGLTLYSFAYDPGGRLTAITDRDGLTTTIERNLDGMPLAIVAAHGQRTPLALGANGFLSSVTNPANEVVQLVHSSSGLLASFVDARNGVHQFGYDEFGRLLWDANPAAGLKTLARAEATRGFSVTLESLVDPTSSLLWSYFVDEVGNGDLQNVDVAPDGSSVSTIRSESGRTTRTLADGTSIVSTSGPDPRFGMSSPIRSTTTTTPAGIQMSTTATRTATLSNSADVLSATSLTETVTVNGRATSRAYDAAARRLTTTTSAGRKTAMFLDAKGRVVRTEPPGYPAIQPIEFGYDSAGRLTTLSQGSRMTSISYNSDGYPDTVTDSALQVTRFLYDPAGRPRHLTLPGSRTVSFDYDRNGNQTSVIPPERPVHALAYDAMNRLSLYDAPLVPGVATGTTAYGYNLHGDPTGVAYPDGSAISAAYYVDATGRPTGKLATLSSWRGTTSMTYDTSGRLATLSAPGDVTLTYGYDGFLPTSETSSGPVPGFVTFGYDNDFRIAAVGVNGSAVSFQYDADGLLTAAGAMTIARQPATGLVSGTALGQVTTTQTYNGYGELREFTAVANGGTAYSYTIDRDNAGRITGKTETIGGATTSYGYGHDDAGRLWTVRTNGLVTATYTYDANGNRIAGPGARSGTYDSQDRMLSYGGASYTYGANGDLRTRTVNGQTTYYVYDPAGALIAATLPDGTELEYVIDGQGRRVGKKVNGQLVEGFLYEAQLRPAAWLDGAGNVYARFVYGTGVNVPEYMQTVNGTYRIVTDHLGSPRLVVDVSTGAIMQRMDFDEWGQVLVDTNPGFQPFGFAGGLYDRDTGLVRFGRRDYDPNVGRWTNKDPVRFSGGLNLYAYVENGPLNNIDPTGEVFNVPAAIAGAFIGGAVGLGGALASGERSGWGLARAAAAGAGVGLLGGFSFGASIGALSGAGALIGGTSAGVGAWLSGGGGGAIAGSILGGAYGGAIAGALGKAGALGGVVGALNSALAAWAGGLAGLGFADAVGGCP